MEVDGNITRSMRRLSSRQQHRITDSRRVHSENYRSPQYDIVLEISAPSVILSGGEAGARNPMSAEAFMEVDGNSLAACAVSVPANSIESQTLVGSLGETVVLLRMTSFMKYQHLCHPERRRSRREGPTSAETVTKVDGNITRCMRRLRSRQQHRITDSRRVLRRTIVLLRVTSF